MQYVRIVGVITPFTRTVYNEGNVPVRIGLNLSRYPLVTSFEVHYVHHHKYLETQLLLSRDFMGRFL